MPHLIVVGCGVFGLSTAIAAADKYTVEVISDNEKTSASWAPARIYRCLYPRDPYTTLANSARSWWKTQTTYHSCPRRIYEADGRVIDDDSSAWVEAGKAMEEARRRAIDQGVKFVSATVTGIEWDGSHCKGVKTTTETFKADIVLLALGYRLPSFLAAQGRSIDTLCYPAAVPWLNLKLDDEQYAQLKGKPITIHPGKGEFLPPRTDGTLSVHNAETVHISDTKSMVQRTGRLPYDTETRGLCAELFGDPTIGDSAPEEALQYCGDLLTRFQDFLVDEVPGSNGLYMAGGGSFHAFKFLPVLGQEILHIVKGETTFYSKFWSVEAHHKESTPVHGEIVPKNEARMVPRNLVK